MRAIVTSGLRGVILGLLVVHFGMTLVYVLPVNPLLLKDETLIERVIGQCFGQVWTLFGPDPVTSNDALLVRPLTDAEAGAIAAHGYPTDGWYDVSTPLWCAFQANRTSVCDRLYRPQMNAILSYLSGGSELVSWRRAAVTLDDAEARATYEKMLKAERADATRLLARVASSFLNQVCPGRDYTQMALQIRIEASVPWSRRGQEGRHLTYIQVGVSPIDRSVFPARFYASTSTPTGIGP